MRKKLETLRNKINYCRITTPDEDNEPAIEDALSILDEIIELVDDIETYNNDAKDTLNNLGQIVY